MSSDMIALLETWQYFDDAVFILAGAMFTACLAALIFVCQMIYDRWRKK